MTSLVAWMWNREVHRLTWPPFYNGHFTLSLPYHHISRFSPIRLQLLQSLSTWGYFINQFLQCAYIQVGGWNLGVYAAILRNQTPDGRHECRTPFQCYKVAVDFWEGEASLNQDIRSRFLTGEVSIGGLWTSGVHDSWTLPLSNFGKAGFTFSSLEEELVKRVSV